MCVSDITLRSGEETYKVKNKQLVEKITKDAINFSIKEKDTAEVQFQVANQIMKETGYDQL